VHRHSKKRPTQQDIADGLGVSVITVQRALGRSGYVSDEMRTRIEEYASEIGYRPHRAAQSLVRGTDHRIAVLSTEAPSFYWDEVEQGVRTAASQIVDFGYETRYDRIPRGDTQAYLARLRELHAGGLDAVALVNNLEYEMERIFAEIDELAIPYVTLNIDAPTSNRRAFVGVDHEAEGRLAANFLSVYARAGQVCLLVAGASPRATALEGADIARKRMAGFESVLGERGMSSRRLLLDDVNVSRQRLAATLRELASSLVGVYVTAIDPEIASLLGQESGVPVVVGTSSPEFARLLKDGSIAAVIYQNPVLQGYYAVRALEHLVEAGDDNVEREVVLVHSLLLRENIGLPHNHQLMVGEATHPRRGG
jgi:LacI family transcriptional regulator